ncbi:hypothetical protein N9E15_03640, partial [Planktomarina temperata]|nr:hypothetical protein [Planktomarina temperata]
MMVRLGSLKLMVCFLAFAATTLPASILFAQELTVKYAAADFKGPPKFTVQAFKNDSSRAVWRSKTITAEGGLDTTRFGNDRNRLKWQNVSFQIPPNLGIDYFKIRFLNDECCGTTRGGKKYGDRNFFVQKITFNRNVYFASRGKQKTCPNSRNKAGEMFCAGTLEIAVKNNTDPATSAQAVSNASLAKSVCGYNFSAGKSPLDLKSIQRGLAKRKLYNGGIDGKFGKGSCSALEKWAKCENVGSKVLSDGALSKLTKTNPSARELACYGKATENVAKLTFSNFELRPVDGRSEGRDIVGSWITLRDVQIDGNPGAKKTIWFEVLGRFPSQRIEMIGFSSTRTFENMPEYIGEKFGNPRLGYGFAVRTQNVASARSRFEKLDKNDQMVLKGICGLMANQSFVADVVKKLESQREFGFRDYVDNQFMKFWKQGSKVREIVSVAESCNRSVGNTGAKSVAFVSSNNSPSVTPASGSIAAVSTCKQSKLQIRFNQNVLKSLDLYTSTVDGIEGPNYRKAVAGGEKLIGQWADAKKDCLGVIERKILEAVVAARKRGSSCEYLPNSTEIKNRFDVLKSAGVTDKAKLDHEKASGLIWMIDTVSELEMRLSFLNFYSSTNASTRDCRLDNEELKALETKPVEPKSRVRYSSIYVNTNDGRSWSVPEKNWLGVDAHFVNASLDGQRTKSRDWLIEISANFDGVNGFLFNSADIFEVPIPKSIATSTNSRTRGHQYGFKKNGDQASRDRVFFNALNKNDLLTAKAACVALTNEEIVRNILSQASSQNKYDNKHSNFWKREKTVSEILSTANRCVTILKGIK